MAGPVAIIGAVSTISSGVQALSGANAKDPERLAANAAAYSAAMQGDSNARDFLRQRTGLYGEANVPGYGVIGGWATEVARNDAKLKYNALQQTAAVTSGVSTVINEGREVLNSAGYDVVPTGGLRTETVLLLVAGGLALYFLVLRKG